LILQKKISEELQDCFSSGKLNTECLEKISLSKIIQKVMSNESSELQDLNVEVSNIVKEELTAKNFYDYIGNITLRDLYDKYTILTEKYPLKINADHIVIGLNLVSYGLILRSFNKFVHERPIPSNLNAQELKFFLVSIIFSS